MFTPRFATSIGSAGASNRASQCLRQQRVQATRSSRPATRNSIPCRTQQQRWQSTRGAQPRINRSKGSFTRNAKILFQAHPYSMTGATIAIGFGVFCLGYINWWYNKYIIDGFKAFPEPVAKQLRKALYYTNMSLEPKNAVKYYKEALRVADEMGMDPFSDEYLGIKISVCVLLEKIQAYDKAIGVYEIMRDDCGKWMEQLGDLERNIGKRTRVLRRMIEISVKIADLYNGEYVLQPDKAEESLVYAVETILKEQMRRQKEGIRPGEEVWLSDEEMGGTFEALAHHYEATDKHHLAAPLFLQAIALSSPATCHTAVLMNNLSISLAQQNPPPELGQPILSRSQQIKNARAWATKSLEICAKIAPPERTEECNIGCAVATHNLGEFAEMDGDIKEARRRYEEARSLASAIGFKEGEAQSEERLAKIGGRQEIVNRS
ncbi:uncharacterized protein EAF01_004346 [Botrytis porri]|uniref:uncharacterized protein n=1 Tax=Botrytis porri TaxID=87229 RepID=UPI001900B53E|nr:uncharacterized protein EAF01_004346 [Botrytis porri]KAF7908591.1 hypothetical protein EAF01_004346 [Botrytis porri]